MILPVYPQPPEVLLGELHDGVEPVPEGEGAVGEGLLAELGPAHQGRGEVVVVAVAPGRKGLQIFTSDAVE